MNETLLSYGMPIIILSHPQMGENIGATARTMSNFGFTKLRIVAPRDGWPNSKAYSVAANGAYILDDIEVYENLTDAVADIKTLYGSASINRFISKDVINPWEVKNDIGDIGFLFGCEKNGLSNDELAICDSIIKIPTATNHHLSNSSLNLAQAVCIIAYEYQKLTSQKAFINSKIIKADKSEIFNMLNHLEESLNEANFFKSSEIKPIMIRNIRTMFCRANLTQQDVSTLFGIFKSLKSFKD